MKIGLFKFYLFHILFTIIIVILSSLFISFGLKNIIYQQIAKDLYDSALLLDRHLPSPANNSDRIDQFCKFSAENHRVRVTVIDRDGKVLGDSENNIEMMGNHSDRPEIISAIQGDQAFSKRFSVTMGEPYAYAAVPVRENGTITAVLRVARSVQDIDKDLIDIRIQAISLLSAVILLYGVISFFLVRYIGKALSILEEGAREISLGNFSHSVYVNHPREAAVVAREMNVMTKKLDNTISEISSQKMELEAIFRSMVESVLLLDMNMQIKRLNSAAAELFRIHPEEAIGKTLIEIFRNSALYDFVKKVRESDGPLETEISFISDSQQETVYSNEMQNNGTKIYLKVHGSLVKSALLDSSIKNKKRDAILLVLDDITTLKNLENIRSDFVANVSHELKTPITSIIGFVETLIGGAIEEKDEALRFLSIIEKHTRRLNSIIDDLLSLSKLEEPKDQIFEFDLIKIHAIIASSVQICREKAEKKEIDIILNCGPSIRAEIVPILIEQALVNIIDNAIKYSEPNSTITISCTERADGETIEISVKDQGYGIPKQDLPRIFERFYRVDKARSRALGGTGLGLSISKHIAKINNGEIEAKSELGIGSTFSLILPKHQNRDGKK